MPTQSSICPRLTPLSCWLYSILSLVIAAFACQIPIYSETNTLPLTEGYITAVESPNEFVVDNRHIAINPQTALSWAGGKTPAYPGNIRDALLLGTFVQVYGYTDNHTKTVSAESIFVRGEWGQKLTGLGVIDKVIRSGPEPIFRADGYPLQIYLAASENAAAMASSGSGRTRKSA